MLGVEMEREGKHGVKCEEIEGTVSGQASGEMGLGLRRFWRPSSGGADGNVAGCGVIGG